MNEYLYSFIDAVNLSQHTVGNKAKGRIKTKFELSIIKTKLKLSS